jgi:hypothetical protein
MELEFAFTSSLPFILQYILDFMSHVHGVTNAVSSMVRDFSKHSLMKVSGLEKLHYEKRKSSDVFKAPRWTDVYEGYVCSH